MIGFEQVRVVPAGTNSVPAGTGPSNGFSSSQQGRGEAWKLAKAAKGFAR